MRSFMDLSTDVRRRIYILAGLVRVCPIGLNTESGDKKAFLEECAEWFRDHMGEPLSFNEKASMRCYYRRKRFMDQTINPNADGFDCICPPLPISLLGVSRAIHHEVSSILFSENMFRICRTERRGLSPLLSLSPLAYKSMTSLSIKLNSCSCIPGHECPAQEELDKECPLCHYTCRVGRDVPLSEIQPGAPDVIFQWNGLVDRLAQCIPPSQLRLSVICDTLDCATAKQIAQPLLRLPTLAECALRLSQAPDPTFHALAEKTVLQSTGRSSSHLDQAFRFLDLPHEIQMQILSHTDLVSEREIELANPRETGGHECCQRCTDSLEACCCPVRHGAYTTGSCTCWSTPLAIFLVNRKFHDCGPQIFFSKNRFKITWDASSGTDNPIHDVLSTVLPAAALPHIQHLRISLGALTYHHLDSNHAFERTWAQAIGFLARKLALPNLRLRIQDTTHRGQSVENLITGRDDSRAVEEAEWNLYHRLVQPIAGLPLKGFEIGFGPPPYGRYGVLRRERQVLLKEWVLGRACDRLAGGGVGGVEVVEAVFGPGGVRVWPLG